MLINAGLRRPDKEELITLERDDRYPRIILFEQSLNADMLDGRYLKNIPQWRQRIYRRVPVFIAQVIEAFLVKRKYSAVFSWAENLGIPFALLMKISRSRVPHIGIFSWISKPKKAILLKKVQSCFDRIILMSSQQRDFAIHTLKIPDKKVLLLRWPVDQKFWRPMDVASDMICAVGREMRDYYTLVKAIEGSRIQCHIAAGGITSSKKDQWIKELGSIENLPSNITMGKKTYLELRELYARSRFVVIPLYPTETDNGTTSILEAMAMGKAIICSKVDGQKDVIQDGINGIFVPPRDIKALRGAIEYLWNNPDIAERMGRAGREFIEQNHSIDTFVGNVRSALQEVLEERNMVGLNGLQKKRKRILTVVTTGLERPANSELRKLEEADLYPRALLYENTLNSEILDERYLRQCSLTKRFFYKFLSILSAQVIEAFLVRKKYDAIITWSGRIALPYALLLWLFRSHHSHIAMVTWISPPHKAYLLRFLYSRINKIVLWSSVQKKFAEEKLKIPSSKLVLIGRRVDHKFFRPMEIKTDMICSVGQEMRDYPTFIKALDGLDIRCHIATGALRGELYDTVKAINKISSLPKNISISRLSYPELRNLYARSRFVVIPLHQTDTDNGVTAIEESMAMGKAVICTRTKGQVDIIRENETGIFVPPYDVPALREAIIYLWNNPDVANKMGDAGREYIVKHHTLDQFVSSVKNIVDDVIEESKRK